MYRLVHFPAADHADLMSIWLRSDQAGVFSHETALTLHDLSDVLPARVHLTVPAHWRQRRLRVQEGVVLHYSDVPREDRSWRGPVPATLVRRTLTDCAAAGLAPDQLRQAARQALHRGLVTKDELTAVDEALEPFGGLTVRTHATPAAFKQALEQRLRAATRSGPGLVRRRQLLVLDRFLARIVDVLGEAVTLKGGLALELRPRRARTTKDIDLRESVSPDDILPMLQAAARRDLGDFMAFEVRRDEHQPDIQGDGIRYDGLRLRATCILAGKLYGQPFGVDVAFGDPILGEPETVVGDDLLGFAGVAPPELRLYPIETHIAEKLHAYTMPRQRPNSRATGSRASSKPPRPTSATMLPSRQRSSFRP